MECKVKRGASYELGPPDLTTHYFQVALGKRIETLTTFILPGLTRVLELLSEQNMLYTSSNSHITNIYTCFGSIHTASDRGQFIRFAWLGLCLRSPSQSSVRTSHSILQVSHCSQAHRFTTSGISLSKSFSGF